MATISPYITFAGNCETAFNFYKSIFGGEFDSIFRFGEMPPQEGFTMPEEMANLIMHISLPISGNNTLMGSDTTGDESFGGPTVIGNNISMMIDLESTEEADRVFNALAQNGKVTMPMANTFWGAYFGMATDQFGISWMINYSLPMQA